jgi:hypothetical protein
MSQRPKNVCTEKKCNCLLTAPKFGAIAFRVGSEALQQERKMGRYFKPQREHYIPKGSIKIADKKSTAVAYIYERNGKVYGMVFVGKQQKPLWHYRFRDAADRAKRIAGQFSTTAASEKQRTEYREASRAKDKAAVFKVGDVFRHSWGYEQTNVDYYQVVGVKGRYATVRQINSEGNEEGFMSGKCVPVLGSFKGEEKRCLMKDGRITVDSYGAQAYFVEPTMVAGMPIYPGSYYSYYA